jgi:hypothetical protein
MWNALRKLWTGPDRRTHHERDVRQVQFTSYDDYVAAQLKTNEAKRDRVWVHQNELRQLAVAILQLVPRPKRGLCHGVRNGVEVRVLRDLLRCEVWGTEISPSAADFEHVIQWDFHQVKDEWLGAMDFIYSNSLDHSYDPQACLSGWLKCLSPRGRCFVHWSREHDYTDFGKNNADCFQATRQGYVQLIESVGSLERVVETDAKGQRCLFVCRAKSANAAAAA